MDKRFNVLFTILMITTLLLPGCGGGSGSNVSATVTGVAAAGSPITGTVYLRDSSMPMKELSAPVAADGSFSFEVNGLKGPFLLKAVGTSNGAASTFFSFAPSDGVANINPLTHLAVVQAAGSDDLAGLYAGASPAAMQSIKNGLPAAVDGVRNVFQPTLDKFGAGRVDFMSGRYLANHQGLDLMLDMTAISAANGTVTIVDRTVASVTNLPVSGFSGCSVNIVPGSIPATGSVVVMPGVSSVTRGASVTFTAVVVGQENQNVTWSVVESDGGTIATSGRYTAPASTGTYHVMATSVADPGKSGQAAVSVSIYGGLDSGPLPPITPPIILPPPPVAKQAILKLGLLLPFASPLPYGFQASITMPAGVSVNTSPEAGAITAYGYDARTDISASFTPQPSGSGVLVFQMISPDGLRGEYVTITCDIGPGYYPTLGNFRIAELKAYDVNGAVIPGAAGTLGMQMVY